MPGFDIFIKERPRTLAVIPAQDGLTDIPDDYPVLLFTHARKKDVADTVAATMDIQPWGTFRAEELLSYLSPATPNAIVGILGLVTLANEIFLSVVTHDTLRMEPIPGHPIRKILGVKFISLSTSLYDPSSAYTMAGEIPPVHPCTSLEKYLNSGTFYHAPHHDLTRPLGQDDRDHQIEEGMSGPDEQFWWNGYMMREITDALEMWTSVQQEAVDEAGIFLTIIQGYAGLQEIRIPPHPNPRPGSASHPDAIGKSPPPVLRVSLISRLGCGRAGARYLTRGIDDEGNVANYVETETIISSPSTLLTHLQLRGSVPLFWEQNGIQLGGHRPIITRSLEATRPAIERHFTREFDTHKPIHIIDLLSQRDGTGEKALSRAYHDQIKDLGLGDDFLRWTAFDINAECPGGDTSEAEALVRALRPALESYGYRALDMESGSVVLKQTGILRVNCLDCLDRTNVMQSLIALEFLILAFSHLPPPYQARRSVAQAALAGLWVENGDALSRIYAGTGALKSGWTRSLGGSALGARDRSRTSPYGSDPSSPSLAPATAKANGGGWMGMLMDAGKSVSRMYVGSVSDPAKQETVDTLLGKTVGQRRIMIWDETREAIGDEMDARRDEYCERETMRLFVGSYNVNGRAPSSPLDDWLHTPGEAPHLVVIGIQEIVELTASQIVASDPAKKAEWDCNVLHCLNSQVMRDEEQYVMLRSGQLVGTSLSVFAQKGQVGRIRRIEYTKVKTGLGGMTGNKGAVAVRLEWGDTSFCFVCAHFASGQDVYDQRNNDYKSIDGWLEFSRGRRIMDHANVIWAGDFNYRLNGENQQIRPLAESGRYAELYQMDQLRQAMESGAAFPGYKEGPLTFAPTYRYDIGSDVYDTSEKRRIPAWTDRVLFKGGDGLRLKSYDAISIRISDHRPIRALFSAEVLSIDPRRRSQIRASLTTRSSMDSLQSRSSAFSHRPLSMSSSASAKVTGTNPPPPPPLPPKPRQKPSDVVELLDTFDFDGAEMVEAHSAPSTVNIFADVDDLLDLSDGSIIPPSLSASDQPRALPPASSDLSKWWDGVIIIPPASREDASNTSANPFGTPPSSKTSDGIMSASTTVMCH